MSAWTLRAGLIVALVTTGTASAVAEPEDVRTRVENALIDADVDAAKAIVDEVVAAADTTDRVVLVDAALASFDLLPHEGGNGRTATLLGAALAKDKGGDGAWKLAMKLQDRLLEELDYAVGEPFARRLMSLYEEPHYARELGVLQVRCGHTDEARATFEALIGKNPSDVETLYALAALEDTVGSEERALAHFQAIIETNGDLEARFNRAKLLARPTVRRFEEAKVALAETLAEVRAAPAGESRDWYLQSLERLKRQIDDAVEQRNRLVALDTRLDRLLWSLGGAWIVVLGGGLAFLRRQRLI